MTLLSLGPRLAVLLAALLGVSCGTCDAERRSPFEYAEIVDTEIEDKIEVAVILPPILDDFVVLADIPSSFPILSNATLSFLSESTEFGLVLVESPYIEANGSGLYEVDTADPSKYTISLTFPEPKIEIELNATGSFSGGMSAVGYAKHKFTRPSGMVLIESVMDVADGVAALNETLSMADDGPRLMKIVDHATAAASVGLSLAPATVILFGSPSTGYPLMLADGAIGVELPPGILVAMSPIGKVYTAYNAPSMLLRRFSVGDEESILSELDEQMATLASSASGVTVSPVGLDYDTARLDGREKLEGFNITSRSGKFDDAVLAYNEVIDNLDTAAPVNTALQVEHDVSANMEGLENGGRFNRVVIFGNPALGTLVMQSSFTAALNLPVRIGIWTASDDSDSFNVGYVTTSWIAERHNVTRVDSRLPSALANFAGSTR